MMQIMLGGLWLLFALMPQFIVAQDDEVEKDSIITLKDYANPAKFCPGCNLERLKTISKADQNGKESDTYVSLMEYAKGKALLTVTYNEANEITYVELEYKNRSGGDSVYYAWDESSYSVYLFNSSGKDSVQYYYENVDTTVETFFYDNKGRLVRRVVLESLYGVDSSIYSYDDRGQLISEAYYWPKESDSIFMQKCQYHFLDSFHIRGNCKGPNGYCENTEQVRDKHGNNIYDYRSACNGKDYSVTYSTEAYDNQGRKTLWVSDSYSHPHRFYHIEVSISYSVNFSESRRVDMDRGRVQKSIIVREYLGPLARKMGRKWSK